MANITKTRNAQKISVLKHLARQKRWEENINMNRIDITDQVGFGIKVKFNI